ncbi:hypothetical protein HPP92_023250 [Vanilla planifolia]|uniref:Uncharacterized protein n=1 Tax=Vanilla planifolia TaxID=51239 RepID=A0A835Q286_VANPL|nr:hypothetical protein HPP92_023250 [Vanilla planifolia]
MLATLPWQKRSSRPSTPPPRVFPAHGHCSGGRRFDESQVKALFDEARKPSAQPFTSSSQPLESRRGIDPTYPAVADISSEQWERTFNINAKGTFLCCREAARRLKRCGGGRIITLSSSTVGSLRRGYGAYAASKAVVEVITRVLAKELSGTESQQTRWRRGRSRRRCSSRGRRRRRVRALADNPMGGWAIRGRRANGGILGQRRRRVGER